MDLLWLFFFLGFLVGLRWSSFTSESELLSLSDEESSTKFQINNHGL